MVDFERAPRIVRNIGGVFLRQFYTVSIGLLTSIVFARLLGPAGTGAYATAQLVPMLLAALFNMGLGSATVVLVNNGTTDFAQARATTLALWRIICLIVVPTAALLILALGDRLLPNVDPLLLYLALALFPFLLLNMVYGGLLQSLEDFGGLNVVLAATPTVTCIVGVLTVGSYGAAGAIGALLAANASTSAIAYWRLRRHEGKRAPFSMPIMKAFLSYGVRSNAADSIQLINYRADLYFVNYFVGPAGAGLYALAISLCEKLWLVAEAMTAVLFPRFSRQGLDSSRLLLIAAALAAGVATAGAIVLAIAARYLIAPVFGPSFQDASNAINWLLPGVVAICFGKILTTFLAARGKLAMNLTASIVGAVVNVSSNLYLTPRYGIVGAAMATSLGYFILVMVVVYSAARELRQMRQPSPQVGTTSFDAVDLRNVTPTV